MEITPTLSISDDELTYSFVRASGPGGQNINKVATAVQLRFDVRNSHALHHEMKERLIRLAGSRMNQEGILVIEAKRFRTQEQNKADAEERLKFLLQKAARRPITRHATKPTLSARLKRIESKKMRGALKKQRHLSPDD
jgi:ribosome-associated protein